MTIKNNQNDPILALSAPWDNNDNPSWIASSIHLARNIEKFKFPAKLEAERQKQIVALLSQKLLAQPLLMQPQLLYADKLTPLQKDFLVEHFLSQLGFHQAHSGEAFVLDSTGTFLATFNIQDHLHLNLIECGGELESAWNRLVAIEMSLGQSIRYAFSPKYGFLTSDFHKCGTALIISIFLQLPALVHSERIESVLEKNIDDSFIVTGIQGNPTEMIGDVLMIQNNFTLGFSEEDIISSLRSCSTKLLLEENSTLRKIGSEESAEIKDKVSRAYGILVHSYQIESIEALNAISLIKLGVILGWISGISIKEINKLFFVCRHAHLLNQYKETLKQEAIPHKRAEFIHNKLKNVKLLI